MGETLGNDLTIEAKGRQRERGKSLRNHGKSRKGRSKSIERVEFYNYGKKGHLKKHCQSQKGNQGDMQLENNQEANVTGDGLQDALILSVDNVIDSQVVESRASFHATSHRNYSQYYVQGDFGQVHLGDDKPCKIVGKGKVKIELQDGNQWLLKEVKHVLDMRNNIISIGQV